MYGFIGDEDNVVLHHLSGARIYLEDQASISSSRHLLLEELLCDLNPTIPEDSFQLDNGAIEAMALSTPSIFRIPIHVGCYRNEIYPLAFLCCFPNVLRLSTLKAVHNAYPSAVYCKQADEGILPVQLAVSFSGNSTPSSSAVSSSSIRSIVAFLLECNPKSIQSRYKDGKTLLHVASSIGAPEADHHDQVDMGVFQLLLQQYPEAALIKDDNGRTPLHNILCRRQADSTSRHNNSMSTSSSCMRMVELIMRTIPKAASIPEDLGADSYGNHEWAFLSEEGDDDDDNSSTTTIRQQQLRFPLEDVLSSNFTFEVISMVANAYPQAVVQCAEETFRLAHVYHSTDHHLWQLFRLLAECYCRATIVDDDDANDDLNYNSCLLTGRTPPLHSFLNCPPFLKYDSAQQLLVEYLEMFPEEIRTWDQHARLALHVALEQEDQHLLHSLLDLLWNMEPRAALIRTTTEGGLYPFLALATMFAGEQNFDQNITKKDDDMNRLSLCFEMFRYDPRHYLAFLTQSDNEADGAS